MYVQIINDEKGLTLVSANSKTVHKKGESKTVNQKSAFELGEKVAELALKKKIKSITFDRNGYRYHGRVKSLADGARKGGLEF